jgi:hypothetical protein
MICKNFDLLLLESKFSAHKNVTQVLIENYFWKKN